MFSKVAQNLTEEILPNFDMLCAELFPTYIWNKKVPSPNSFFRYFDFSNPTTLQKDVGKRQRQSARLIFIKMEWYYGELTRPKSCLVPTKSSGHFWLKCVYLFMFKQYTALLWRRKYHYDAPVHAPRAKFLNLYYNHDNFIIWRQRTVPLYQCLTIKIYLVYLWVTLNQRYMYWAFAVLSWPKAQHHAKLPSRGTHL